MGLGKKVGFMRLFCFCFLAFICVLRMLMCGILLNFKSGGKREKTVLSVLFHIGAPNLMVEVLKRTFYRSEL